MSRSLTVATRSKSGVGRARVSPTNGARVKEIEIEGPGEVIVGKEFKLKIRTTPPVTDFPVVTVVRGTEYSLVTRRLKKNEIADRQFRLHQRGNVSYPKGVFLTFYGLAKVMRGRGEIRVTQFSHEGFQLKVALGSARKSWSVMRKNVKAHNGEKCR